MITLEDAWSWYRDARDMLRLVERFARKHWSRLDWRIADQAGPEDPAVFYDGLGRDETLRDQTADMLEARSRSGLAPLDNLAVLVMFSVFESLVRDSVAAKVEIERRAIRHPALIHAINGALEQIREGSFFRGLEPYKSLHGDLIEEVNQIRRYRNWVAHGRRGVMPAAVDPTMAYDRLTRFWTAFREGQVSIILIE